MKGLWVFKKYIDFRNWTYIAVHQVHFNELDRLNRPRTQRSFPFQKISETLKIDIFSKKFKFLHFTSKNNRQKEHSKFKICCIPPKWAKLILTSGLLFQLNKKIKADIPPCIRLKKRLKNNCFADIGITVNIFWGPATS